MKSLQDALYNWLSIKVVCDARPEDKAAKETLLIFEQKLAEEHNVQDVVINKNESVYKVTCKIFDNERTLQFPVELIEFMLRAIEREPNKYPIYNDLEK
ncbi:hypothetical protein [Calidifontibacillus oryziterrae]|uniref:hypothetical protein n=1 Tax=Calidifontibacillus oryziterrae TaxID=1191699 RepID=UPI00030630E8|nr:hypothetical protein [Calidifontibacillus oryziterrae]